MEKKLCLMIIDGQENVAQVNINFIIACLAQENVAQVDIIFIIAYLVSCVV